MPHSRIHTLVVDDEQDVREMLSLRLEMQGHVVAVAEDGSRALEMIQAQKFDLVLLDIMMPRLNGYEVLKRLKADILLRNIPVIVISAVHDIDSVVKCIEMGAEDYLLKPFNAILLKARITAVLQKKWWRDQEFEYLEELLLMQRIDREMNISLDITRTLRIALECAIHHAGANAGLAGIVEEAGIRIVATQGYRTENAPRLGAYLPCELPAVREAIQSKQPRPLSAEETRDSIGWVVTGPKLTIIPVCRGANAIGLLLIEARAGNHIDDTLPFLTRLSDHAAIAISNAQLYAAVQAANNAKSEFVTLAAHELRAPMTSIKACTDLLAAGSVGPVNEAQAGFLSTIQSNVDRMMKLVADLADISRIESGNLNIDFSAVPIIEIVQEVIQSSRGQIEEKGQTLILHIPEDLPAVWGDRARLIQVFTNLIGNACKYTLPGGQISIHAERTLNRWSPREAPEVVHVAIQDTGIGISPADQKRIFQKFFRSEDVKVWDVLGTGLGLNIVKNLIEMQGGLVWFESELSKGTTFHFTVPVATADEIG